MSFYSKGLYWMKLSFSELLVAASAYEDACFFVDFLFPTQITNDFLPCEKNTEFNSENNSI